MAKVHKLVVFVVDQEGYPDEDVVTTLVQNRYYNFQVLTQEVKSIEFDDDEFDNHPLNHQLTLEQFDEQFSKL